VSRGQFLGVCGAALVGAAIEARGGGGARNTTRPSARPARAAIFLGQVGTTFVVAAPAAVSSRLVLARVVERTSDPRLEQFSAIFDGTPDVTLADGIYDVSHPVLGQMTLFIAAAGRPVVGAATYEACFGAFRTGAADVG
jgi:hypothetical protein